MKSLYDYLTESTKWTSTSTDPDFSWENVVKTETDNKQLQTLTTKQGLSDELKDMFKRGMTQGYIMSSENGKIVKWGISEENLFGIIGDDFNADDVEEIKKYIDDLKKDGYNFRFKKDSEFLKQGYRDPNEE